MQKKNALDYFSGGMAMPNRNVEGEYRYGYQGEFAEKDDETGLNAFELRMYDSRINRWISPDPAGQYHSPYMSMGNNWISLVDPDGAKALDDYKLIDGVVTFWRENKGPDRLYNADGTKVLGTANYGVLKQLDGFDLFSKDFSLLTFNNRSDFDSFLDFTADISRNTFGGTFKEAGGLFLSDSPVSDIENLKTGNFDLYFAGYGWAGQGDGVTGGVNNTDFLTGVSIADGTISIKNSVYNVAAIYHNHSHTPAPSGQIYNRNGEYDPYGDVGVFYTNKLNGVIQGLRGSRGYYNSSGNGFWDISGFRVNYKH